MSSLNSASSAVDHTTELTAGAGVEPTLPDNPQNSDGSPAVEHTNALTAGGGDEPTPPDNPQHSASSPATPTGLPEAADDSPTPCKCGSWSKIFEADLRLAEAKVKVFEAERDLLVSKAEHGMLEVVANCCDSNEKCAAAATAASVRSLEERAIAAERRVVDLERRNAELASSDAEDRVALAEDRAAAAEKQLADVQERLAIADARAEEAIHRAEAAETAKEVAEDVALHAEIRANLADDHARRATHRSIDAENRLKSLKLQQPRGIVNGERLAAELVFTPIDH